jgi:hypothetical protein
VLRRATRFKQSVTVEGHDGGFVKALEDCSAVWRINELDERAAIDEHNQVMILSFGEQRLSEGAFEPSNGNEEPQLTAAEATFDLVEEAS